MNYKYFSDNYASNVLKADPLKALIAFSKRIPMPTAMQNIPRLAAGLKYAQVEMLFTLSDVGNKYAPTADDCCNELKRIIAI